MEQNFFSIFILTISFFIGLEEKSENTSYNWESSINQSNCIECHSNLKEKKRIHAPIEDACDNCHTKNENSHPDGQGREFKLTDVMPSLCYICHEEPTKKRVHVPVEEGECTMCHSPHSSNNRKLLIKKELSSLCFECHDLEFGEKDRIHAPVEMGACEDCHDPHQSDNRSLLKSQKPQLCLTCHDNIQTEIESRYPHAAAVDDCGNCHDPHSSKNRKLLIEKIPELCFSCHDPFNQKYGHSPAQEGECFSCHAVHGSNNRKLLTEREPVDLCLMCHDLEMETSKMKHAPVEAGECVECHSPHDSNNRGLLKLEKARLCMTCHSELEANLVMINTHPPFEDDCGNCHDPHKSNEPKLLIEKSNDLCFICHDDIQEKINHQSIVHAVAKENGACIKCHSPHASNESALLKKREKDLCLSCHNKEYDSEFGKIKNIKNLIDNSKHVHPPVDDGCTSCHDPHAEKYPYLLRDYTAPMMYAPANTRNFQLCFNCHDKELMTYKSGNLATNFRNGNLNLHYVHLKGEKARNCNICHDAHAADGEHLIREKTWFGQWEMPIGYEPSLKGGSCLTGCHEKREYFR